MIDSEYYRDYNGPDLVVAELWRHENDKETITDYISVFYGESNNWNGKLYTYDEIFPQRENHKFYLEFRGSDGRKHWFSGMVGSKEQIFNPPLVTPINQKVV